MPVHFLYLMLTLYNSGSRAMIAFKLTLPPSILFKLQAYRGTKFQSPTVGTKSQLTNGNQHWISRLGVSILSTPFLFMYIFSYISCLRINFKCFSSSAFVRKIYSISFVHLCSPCYIVSLFCFYSEFSGNFLYWPLVCQA